MLRTDITTRRAVEQSLFPTAFFLSLSVPLALLLPVYGIALAAASLYAFVTNVLYTMVLARALLVEGRSGMAMILVTCKLLLLLLAVRLLALLPTGAIVVACIGFLTIVSWGAARLSQGGSESDARQTEVE